MTIKAIKYLLILMISLILTGCGNGKDDPLLRDINGHSFHFSDLRGKWVFINYWATWCGPCKKEIPQLNQFYESNKQKDVVVFGVNYDQVPSKEIKIMAAYSAKANTANHIPEYSTKKPATSSASPSGKSKGERLHSAAPEIK